MKFVDHTASSSLDLPPGSYIYRIVPIDDKVAAISSDDTLRIADPTILRQIPNGIVENVNGGVTCLESHPNNNFQLSTAGRDGLVKTWDLRTRRSAVEYRDDSAAAYVSLCYGNNGPVAGTELINFQACVIVWDSRAPKKPLLQYDQSHSDDVTVVQFHPAFPQRLLSGSTDGLINIYDTTHTDEDEALVQVANHGSSIHHSCFLSNFEFCALSHDENFSIYHSECQENDSEDRLPNTFGDLRSRLECEYVVDVIPSLGHGEAIIAAGSHSKQQLDIIALRHTGTEWTFDPSNLIRLRGAHGDEIVRSTYFNHGTNSIFTAGEDGKIKAWRTAGSDDSGETQMEELEVERPKKKKKRDSIDNADRKGRFKPY